MANEQGNVQPVINLAEEKRKWEAEAKAMQEANTREAQLKAREDALALNETKAKWNARLPKVKESYLAKGGKVGKDDADFKTWANDNKDALLASDEDKIASVVIGSQKTHGVYFNTDDEGNFITASQEFKKDVETKVEKGDHKFRRIPGTTTRVG